MAYVPYLIGLAVIGAQFFLSRRNNVYWGAVLPVLYNAAFVYAWLSGFIAEGRGTSMISASVGGTIVLLSLWANGRKSVENKRKKELEKIRLRDL